MKQPIVAIMYDFDKTLCTKDMQEYAFIPALGMSSSMFWGEVNAMTDSEEMDNILAYMYKMVEKAKEKKVTITRDTFREMGSKVEYFDGVKTWFERINAYAEKIGVRVEHYIVSSGIKEIIEGTEIAHFFKKIYACEFMYDYTGSIQWPKFAVNYTAKTQFLFRINKGVLTIDSKSADKLNRFTPENERRVPFRNMIYIGDGLTDVPCMKLVKSNGGQSIAVFDQEKGKDAAEALKKAERVNFITAADYGPGSDMEIIVQAILKKIQAVEEMQSY
ncbi:haloacid dehalogenase-like hydrolase [Pseudoflavonifractor phocaeensis]|uniref:HAD family hydrolase n=1 Tax=Pseudoflavonifractor phocaeensis TaxID=1870988 RepID=UPI0019591114|nr:HAD family hydrolase [Pseudoflavonifractor phocaeensis]MBM6937264.1 haloacid dehalogenase-like hydrolase [Pseudoflavonifractor phocaeensis]